MLLGSIQTPRDVGEGAGGGGRRGREEDIAVGGGGAGRIATARSNALSAVERMLLTTLRNSDSITCMVPYVRSAKAGWAAVMLTNIAQAAVKLRRETGGAQESWLILTDPTLDRREDGAWLGSWTKMQGQHIGGTLVATRTVT